jgi:hypothetical protein
MSEARSLFAGALQRLLSIKESGRAGTVTLFSGRPQENFTTAKCEFVGYGVRMVRQMGGAEGFRLGNLIIHENPVVGLSTNYEYGRCPDIYAASMSEWLTV